MTRPAALRLLLLGLFASVQMVRADAFLYDNGVFSTITVPGDQFGTAFPYGINNLGQIVGNFFDTFNPGIKGFLDTDGVLTTFSLPSGAGGTLPTGINDAGQIVGYYNPPASGSRVGFVYEDGVFSFPSPIVIPPGGSELFFGINNSGTIIGETGDTSGYVGYIANPAGGTILLDFPTAINNVGEVVVQASGSITCNGGVVGGSYLYDYNTGVLTAIDLPGPATGINDSGTIVGYFDDCSGREHGYVDTNGVVQTFDVPVG
jgi:probable HAF family extracellular repeat protein